MQPVIRSERPSIETCAVARATSRSSTQSRARNPLPPPANIRRPRLPGTFFPIAKMKTATSILSQLTRLKTDTYGKDFLLTWEKSDDEIRALALVAELLSDLHRAKKSLRVFDTGLAISIFRDNSTRTRFSFAPQ